MRDSKAIDAEIAQYEIDYFLRHLAEQGEHKAVEAYKRSQIPTVRV